MTDATNHAAGMPALPKDEAGREPAMPELLGPWALMWRKFRRHRVAYASLWIVVAI